MPSCHMLSQRLADDVATALRLILRHLAGSGYRFTTPAPLTHQRVLAHRSPQMAATLRDFFGWNMPFKIATCVGTTRELLAAMRVAGVLHTHGDVMRSLVRVGSIGDELFVHSAYPTSHDDAVFFGPDTYRFAQFVQHGLATFKCDGS